MGCTLHHLLIHNLEGHKVHLVWYIRCVLHLRMEVEQTIVGVESTQQILDAERLAADVLDVAFVVPLWIALLIRCTNFGDSLPSSCK